MNSRARTCRGAASRTHGIAVTVGLAAAVITLLGGSAPDAQAGELRARGLLAGARTWGYQLQNIDAARLARTDYDLLVLDAGSGDGSWGLKQSEIARLKRKPGGGSRLVVAYMNIGEAEDYRYYWQPRWKRKPPAWMGSANCRWKGDHRVQHWSPEWQSIIFGSPKSYLGLLIALGYDGVYLDRIDIFYHWRRGRWQAAADMVEFVARLSAWAKSVRPGFLVIAQNGEELASDPRFLAAIDGYGKEDMLYGDRGNDAENAPERVARAERNFAPVKAAGLPIFAIEYMRDEGAQTSARRRLDELGFRHYFGPRSLAYIGHEGAPHAEDRDTESVSGEAGAEGCE
ncbi:MAG: MJ1477/TM1410 family putative glycoside hydrolase [Hyphomicrobiaceae bacterium]